MVTVCYVAGVVSSVMLFYQLFLLTLVSYSSLFIFGLSIAQGLFCFVCIVFVVAVFLQ